MPMGTTDAIESTETSASYDNGMMGGGVKLQTTMTSKQCALPSPPLGGLVPNGINDLLVQCCAHDPKVRPTFAECLSMLEGSIRDEVLRQESAPITQTAPTRNSAVTLARMDAGGGGGGAGAGGERKREFRRRRVRTLLLRLNILVVLVVVHSVTPARHRRRFKPIVLALLSAVAAIVIAVAVIVVVAVIEVVVNLEVC
mmetsp:Transcript_53886/g.100523  ORF Transcript_53886/g.100523 Transcript_53886/m.100523 type:complete len:199 (-) Transcript_53886:944-1540(-)